MHALLLAAALLLSPPEVEPQTSTEAAPVAIPTPTSITALPPELRQRFHDEVLSTRASQRQRLEQTLRFMLDAQGLAITYDEAATHSVAQTYAARKANCLSFTLLFLALAREAGLDAQPQEIENILSWRQHENTIYRNNHVNARVRINGRIFTIDTSGDTVIAGADPVTVTPQRLLAHYYNNLAMERFALGDTVGSQQLMDTALAADATYAPLWSNAGVLRVHEGDFAAAEQAYLKALAIDAREDSALFNMVALSRRRGDHAREAEYRRRLDRVRQRDPLYHFMLAMDHERNGDHANAVTHYRRAIGLHGGEHRFYSALARTLLKAGDTKRAGKALLRAQALADGEMRAAYRAQLQELKRPLD